MANTATIALPGGVTDPTPGNNTATDTDTLTPTADLSITKTDGVTSTVPGTSVTYTIVATNAGPSRRHRRDRDRHVAGVADRRDLDVRGVPAGGTCPASGSGSIISASVNLAGRRFGDLHRDRHDQRLGATGNLANTATVAAPGGVTDPTPGNNSATDTDTLTPKADLSITKTDGVTSTVPGTPVDVHDRRHATRARAT